MLAQIEKTEDLRVRRTRMMLQNAFMELLEKKSFQSITIQEIADLALVNRATFYDHFADKYALLEYSMREWFRQTLESKLPEDFDYCIGNLQFLVSTVCEFLEQIDGHCGPIEKRILPPYDTQVTGVVSELLLNWLQSPENRGNSDSPELTADVLSWAIYGAALHWNQKKPRTESAADFAARATPLMASIMKSEESKAGVLDSGEPRIRENGRIYNR